MGDVIGHYYLEALMGLSLVFLGVLYRKVKKMKCDYDMLNAGIVALLRNDIHVAHRVFMKQGYMPIHEKENIEKLYLSYHGLGGNDTATDLIKEMRELPIYEKEPPR